MGEHPGGSLNRVLADHLDQRRLDGLVQDRDR
jgi:hypothetical protein